MSRPTDVERGARIALDAALPIVQQPDLFHTVPRQGRDDSHELRDLWASIFDSAEQTLLEERWAAEARREATA